MFHGRYLWFFCFAFFCCLSLPAGAQGGEVSSPHAPVSSCNRVLKLGIVPFTSSAALLRIHQPLRDHLTRALGCEVMIYTSRDHENFLDDALEGRFDILVTTAHFLPILSKNGFIPLVRYETPFYLLLVVKKDGGVHGVKDLRGRRVGLPDRLSLYHIAGIHWLESTGMKAGKDYSLSEYASHMAELIAVSNDWLDVAITGLPPWQQLSADMRARLRLVDPGGLYLSVMTTLASRELGEKLVEDIRAALLSFPQSPEGKEFFVSTGYGGYVASVPADIEEGRVYEVLMRRLWTPRTERNDDGESGTSPGGSASRAVGHE
jgi:phosphonate transport system substrate-binding protein